MHDLLPQLLKWQEDGDAAALATVVSAWGSAPRPLGSKMAISSSGKVAGSVSGGCVEAAVAEEAQLVLASGAARLVTYGVSNETAWSVGLSCGGRIEILIEAVDSIPFAQIKDRLLGDRICARVISLEGEQTGRQVVFDEHALIAGSLGSEALDEQASSAAKECLERLSSGRTVLDREDESEEFFIDLYLPRPKLIIVGAVHVAIHLVALARRLGYWTAVIDPRTVFATEERFAKADALLTEWPQDALVDIAIDKTTCLVFLSHDLKIDLPGLEIALRSPALYVGALGSRKTHAKRVQALEDLGFSADEWDRISAPIGLDLGGRRAEEIALSIIAEIVAVRHGGKVLRR
jgi:xanthine dehydrogenase accessory factor